MKNLKVILGSLLIAGLLSGCSSDEAVTKNEVSASKDKKVEESDKSIKVGVLRYTDHVSLDAARDGFMEELKKEGLDVEFVDKSANGDMGLMDTVAKSLIADDCDLIYAISTPSAQAAKNVTSDTPIVFSAVTDPVGAGLVDDFEKPDGNITGVSDYVDPADQVDEFLKLYPDVKTFGVLYNTSEQNSQVQIETLKKTLDERGLKLETVGVNTINDIPTAITSLSTKMDALFALTDNMVANAAPTVSQKLIDLKIPSLSSEEGQVKGGLLTSQGVNYKAHGAQAGRMAIKILKGEEVKNLPCEYNESKTKLVNKKTAEALGLDLNNEVLKDADLVD